MNKHDKRNLREWWEDVKWGLKYGYYDWVIPVTASLVLVGAVLWSAY